MMVIIAIALCVIAAACLPLAVIVTGDILRWVGRVLWFLLRVAFVIGAGVYLFA